MLRIIDERPKLASRKLGRIFGVYCVSRDRNVSASGIATVIPALLALALSFPAHAQTPADAATITSRGVTYCDPAQPDCPAAKHALAEAMNRHAQQTAQNVSTSAAPAPAATTGVAFGGLAAAAAAKADENSIRFGLIAPFSGANKDFAGELKLGAETAFATANDAGGVNGKFLRLIVADDGYDPERTPELARSLAEKDKVFGFLSNFGSATSAAILPYVLEHKLAFFGAFSGSGALRRQPPDRYVFNYRPSYAEETEAVVKYLVKVRRLKPSEIAVFAQDDAFGDAGYAGVEKAVRSMDADASASILHLRYARNSIDVGAALDDLRKHRNVVSTSVTKVRQRVASVKAASDADTTATAAVDSRPHYRETIVKHVTSAPGIKAVVMVATYRAAAKFIEKAHDLYPDMIYTNVSAVGSNNFAEELKLLGPRFTSGVIVTQVVPDPAGYSSIALEYKTALAKYFPAEHPDYVSFESYINAKIMLEGLKKAGPQPDSDKLVNALENIHGLDLGLGETVNYGASEHQAIHKVWGSQLDEQGHYHFIDLE